MLRRERKPICAAFMTAFVCALLLGSAGCSEVVKYASRRQQTGSRDKGIVLYIGGAGPIGHVGSLDIPAGLQYAGYEGFVEVFTWQGMTHAGDQINITRNREKAAELAAQIRRYKLEHPYQQVDIIALSAGTGIATFALEYLPEHIRVDNVVFLGCSLSSEYDMTRALRRIRGGLYVIHSCYDRILKDLVWYTGTVDRSSAARGVAGLEGMRLPKRLGRDTEAQYEKVHNVPYRWEFADTGYGGGHIDSTHREFIGTYVAPVFMGNPSKLLGTPKKKVQAQPGAKAPGASSQPSSRPAQTSRPADRQ
jgi:hypothetical protein